MNATDTATDRPVITVTTPCNCGKRWFACSHRETVATYECNRTLDGIAGAVHPLDVSHVAALHPGMDLIYA